MLRSLSTLCCGLAFVLAASTPGFPHATAGEAVARSIEVPAPKAGRDRHLVVVLADNAGTETTDLAVPYGVLRESGLVDVVTASTRPGPVALHPALQVRTDTTLARFDAEHPAGADIVIVPALHRPDDVDVTHWLRAQAEAGALVVGVCDGVLALGHAGLLDGKDATGHWYSFDKLVRTYPATTWVRDRRYVADEGIVTTTGVTASIPVSLAVVEAIAGRETAAATAARLGVSAYDAAHDSAAFRLDLGHMITAAANRLAFWRRETIVLPVHDGIDEIALALTADAWSRTYRSRARTTHGGAEAVRSKRGLVIEVDERGIADGHPPSSYSGPPAAALDRALDAIAERYGGRTADFVALQLEYPRP